MTSTMLVRALGLAGAGAMVLGGAQAAQAAIWSYTFTQGGAGMPSANNDAGYVAAFSTTFDTVSKRLTFSATFGPRPGQSTLSTNGFWLALNGGPNPKNHPGEMALYYFDASNTAAPKMTVYGYNGVNGPNSWQDGDPVASGNQIGDLIHGVNDTSYRLSPLSVVDVGSGATATRTMSFDINASAIIGHTPLYPDAVDPWTGTGFADKLGIWFHPIAGWSATYNQTSGRITALSTPTQGWVDAENLRTTQIIPTPGAAALMSMGLMLAGRRRR